MPISGLVLTLAPDSELAREAVRTLEAIDAIELGERNGPRLAAVLDTTSEDENRSMWRRLNELPGVSYVDVVFVSLDDDAGEGVVAADADQRKDAQPCGRPPTDGPF